TTSKASRGESAGKTEESEKLLEYMASWFSSAAPPSGTGVPSLTSRSLRRYDPDQVPLRSRAVSALLSARFVRAPVRLLPTAYVVGVSRCASGLSRPRTSGLSGECRRISELVIPPRLASLPHVDLKSRCESCRGGGSRPRRSA